jgi:hypothetical protein
MLYSSIRNELDSNSRIQLDALRLKIQNLTLPLLRKRSAVRCHSHLPGYVAVEVSTSIHDFDRLRLPSYQYCRVILRLYHGILDSLPPALARQAGSRSIRQAPFDAANTDMLHGGQVRRQ